MSDVDRASPEWARMTEPERREELLREKVRYLDRLLTATRLYTAELAELRTMRDGLEELHVDARRWLTESDPMPNLRAAAAELSKHLDGGE